MPAHALQWRVYDIRFCVDRAGPFAGEPAPTGTAVPQCLQSPCGSGFSREEASTGNAEIKRCTACIGNC
ncbi:protein of unknown function [Pseudomonas sp. JV551A1]|nr:protein of unknown function [Pseudomonas sp. JV551A1]